MLGRLLEERDEEGDGQRAAHDELLASSSDAAEGGRKVEGGDWGKK